MHENLLNGGCQLEENGQLYCAAVSAEIIISIRLVDNNSLVMHYMLGM